MKDGKGGQFVATPENTMHSRAVSAYVSIMKRVSFTVYKKEKEAGPIPRFSSVKG
jgi:hypothetical protein